MSAIRYVLCVGFLLTASTVHAQGTFTPVDNEAVPGPGDNMVVVERGRDRYTVTLSVTTNIAYTHKVDPSGVMTLASMAPTGSSPRAIALAHGGDYAVIVNSDSDDVSVMSIANNGGLTEVGRFSSGGDNPFDVAVAFDDLVVVANRDSDSVVLFGINRRGEMQPICCPHPTGLDPHVVAVGPQGTVAVANSTSNDLTIFDLDRNGNMTLVDEAFEVGNSPKTVAFSRGGHAMFVGTRSPNVQQDDQIQAYKVRRSRGKSALEPAGSTPAGALLTDIEVADDLLLAVSVNAQTGRDQIRAFDRKHTELTPSGLFETTGPPPSFKNVTSTRLPKGERLVLVNYFQGNAVQSLLYSPK